MSVQAQLAEHMRDQVRQHVREQTRERMRAPPGSSFASLSPDSAAPGLPSSAPPPGAGLPAADDMAAHGQHESMAPREHAETGHAADNLGHKLTELQNLIDSRSPEEARALADSLRTSVLRPSAAHPLRRRGAAMIKQVYLQEGDKDALLSFTQDEVSLLEGALIEAARDNPMAMR